MKTQATLLHRTGIMALTALVLSACAQPLLGQRTQPLTVVETVKLMKERGARPEAVAAELRTSYRFTANESAETMKLAGFDARAVGSGLTKEYRTDGYQLYDALKKAEYGSRDVVGALEESHPQLNMDCIGPDGWPMPCREGNAPAMGEVTWSPMNQGIVDELLSIDGSYIPEVQVRIGGTTLEIQSATSSRVVAILPSSPLSGALTLIRVSDGVVGELEGSYTVTTYNEDWDALATVARIAAVAQGTKWLDGAKFLEEECTVNSSSAIAGVGVFQTDNDFDGSIAEALLAAGAPPDIAQGWSDAFQSAWHAWSDGVTIPGLPLYPTFVLTEWPEAEPIPNVPAPLTGFVSSGVSEMSSSTLSARLKSEVGTSSPALEGAIDDFAADIGGAFSALLLRPVTLLMGWGPVSAVVGATGPVQGGSCGGTGVIPFHAFGSMISN